MFDEALREFRRVAELQPARRQRAFYLGLIALRQARGRRRAAFRAGRRRGRARGRPAAQPRRSRWSGWAGWTRREARAGDAARPGAATTRGSCSGGASCAPARRASGGAKAGWRGRASCSARPAAGGLVLGRRARQRGHRRRRRRAREPPGREPRPFPATPSCRTTWPCCSSSAATGRRGSRAARGAGRGPVAAAGLQEPGRHPLPQRRATRRRKEAYERAASCARAGRRPVLQAGQHPLQAARARRGARAAGAARTALNPGHELARANLDMLDLAP